MIYLCYYLSEGVLIGFKNRFVSIDSNSLFIQDNDTGQTVLGGMGELHLEIILDRLKTQYKVDTDMGKLQVQ